MEGPVGDTIPAGLSPVREDNAMTKTPEVISRRALMNALRDLGIDPTASLSMTVTYDGVELENFIFNGRNKVVEMGKDGEFYAKTETVHIRFVD
jgi:hypothetical protein